MPSPSHYKKSDASDAGGPLLYVPDDPALVDTPVQFNDNLTRPVVVNVFELVDVPCDVIMK